MKFSTFERQGSLCVNRLKKIKEHVTSLVALGELTAEQLEDLFQYVEEGRSKASEVEKSLNKLLLQDSIPDYNEAKVLEIEDEISSLRFTINSVAKPHLANRVENESSFVQDASTSNSGCSLKLPPLTLKTFNGSPEQWLSFFSLFESSVHNNSNISDIEKFQYLLSSLQGEPLNLIKNLPITSHNYGIAFNTLQQRYQNNRKIIMFHINSLIDMPSVSNPTAKNLRNFISYCQENIQALSALKHDVKKNNGILSTLLLRKLDSDSRKKFEEGREDAQKMPEVQEILTYLENECSHMEAASLSQNTSHRVTVVSTPNSTGKSASQTSKHFNRTPKTILLSTSKQTSSCTFCGKNYHNIYNCNEFRNLSSQQKYDFVKRQHFCFNCLGSGHSLKECKSRNVCSKCHKKHHTWLHLQKNLSFNSSGPTQQNKLEQEVVSASVHKTSPTSNSPCRPTFEQPRGFEPNPVPSGGSPRNALVAFSQNSSRPNCTILLGTTLVQLTSPHGHSLIARAVVDSASMVTCISESVARLLSVQRTHNQCENVDGLSSCQIKTKGLAKVNILTLSGSSIVSDHPVIILDKITSKLPHLFVSQEIREKYKSLVLADPTFNIPSAVDMLLGADVYTKIMTGERLIIHESLPAAMNSVFGFIIIGSAPTASTGLDLEPSNSPTTLLTVTPDVDLHRSLQKFWVIEEPPHKSVPNPEEVYCENHFEKNHFRNLNGQYVVRLPIKHPHPPLGDSADVARRRFLSLEKRMNADPIFKKSYVDCMDDYLTSGDMEIVKSRPSQANEHFFLPHHAVTKEESSTTKTRIVFDASARSSNGVSLNQILHSGPKLHNEICDIILDFRCYSIVFSCDIKKMFRQIQVDPDDRNYQLLFWRENPTLPLDVYRLTTVVFGFSCSPYLAIRTLKQLVKDEGDKYPLAARALEKQIYVDDLFLGAYSIEEAVSLQNETVQLLLKGGFHLRKWKTNCPQLVSSLPDEYKEKPLYFQSNNLLYNFLGIKWTAESDCFTFHYEVKRGQFTKRNILSTVAQIFDPCGWLAPITFWAKSLLQLLWTLGLQWDEIVPANIAEKWERFLSQLPELDHIQIPRYLSLHPSAADVQLHGFSDGSEAGYSAVVYIRCIYPDDQINVHLLLAKSKVAPLKRISVPRLELCGAYLLAKLLHYCIGVISKHCQLRSATAWSDSSVVLSWIHTPPYRLKVYVANRVAQIQDWISPHSWSHISTHHNPADCASRGLFPASLKNHHLWWHGPPWLQHPENRWPNPCFTPHKEETLPEIKVEPLQVLVVTKESDVLNNFSSWSTLQRVIAYILRFKNNSANKVRETGFLKLYELDRAVVTICKIIQQTSFREDILSLKAGKACSSRLASLSPFLDETDLVRVGGRIKHSPVPYTAKHPIVLPKSHHISNLIIDFYHLKYLHAGPQFLQAIISQRFWILSSRGAIRSRVFKCTRCFRCNPKTITQKMGDLPPLRVKPSRVFNNCGTDFLGPFSIKPNKLRKVSPIKVYICIFICFSVKAVHLEVVTDLSADAYLAALTRFVSRRGLCSNIYSDCGTNYVGAANEVKKLVKNFLSQKETQNALNKFSAENHIQFHFLPPAAPHQGGLWERTVRSVKHHLRRVIGEQILTLEEFITLTTRIEAILNSRPITPLSSDPNEVDFLTPGHFLIGGPLLSLPEQDWGDVPTNRISRWKLVQALTQSFWKRWHQEYLCTLQERGKWRCPQPNVKIGDLVLLHEPHQPPLSWRMGRVTSTSPGQDGLVRVVHLQTSRGPVSRPITKVSPFPADD